AAVSSMTWPSPSMIFTIHSLPSRKPASDLIRVYAGPSERVTIAAETLVVCPPERCASREEASMSKAAVPAHPPAQDDPAIAMAHFAATLTFEQLPGDVVDRLKRIVLDTIGTTLAG